MYRVASAGWVCLCLVGCGVSTKDTGSKNRPSTVTTTASPEVCDKVAPMPREAKKKP